MKRVCGCVTHAVKEEGKEERSRVCVCVCGIRPMYQADTDLSIKPENGQSVLTTTDKM